MFGPSMPILRPSRRLFVPARMCSCRGASEYTKTARGHKPKVAAFRLQPSALRRWSAEGRCSERRCWKRFALPEKRLVIGGLGHWPKRQRTKAFPEVKQRLVASCNKPHGKPTANRNGNRKHKPESANTCGALPEKSFFRLLLCKRTELYITFWILMS